MIKSVIIDDEAHARQAIRTIIESSIPEIQVIAEADSVANALEILKKNEPQLIFLDIDLPDGNGFDILNKIDYKKYRIIFITAYQDYAIQAIRFSAFDYILKPVNPTDLIKAVNNCLAEEIHIGYEEKIQTFFTNFNHSTPEQKKIVLKTASKIHVVDIKNIIRCQSDNAYTTFYLNTGSRIMVSRSIKSYDEMLSSLGFLRVHQSHLINLQFISFYNKQDGGNLVMSDQSNVPVSNNKKPLLLEYLNSLEK
ncbi:MAG: LytTR family DNA-binding domain-containing protein [Bacteroidota bacterium]|nr:LytTR family DNA-binding domain-containing protein [Bacteroidota bacterium]